MSSGGRPSGVPAIIPIRNMGATDFSEMIANQESFADFAIDCVVSGSVLGGLVGRKWTTAVCQEFQRNIVRLNHPGFSIHVKDLILRQQHEKMREIYRICMG